jgi:hypothetical protein
MIMSSLAAARVPAQIVRDLSADERIVRACRFFIEHAAEITEEHAALCAIPAPPFGEAARAEYLAARFRQCGLDEVEIDAEGNCVALNCSRPALRTTAAASPRSSRFCARSTSKSLRRKARSFSSARSAKRARETCAVCVIS